MDIFHERSCFFLHRNSLIYLLSLTISQWPNSAFLTWEKAAAQTECVRYPSAKSPAANIDCTCICIPALRENIEAPGANGNSEIPPREMSECGEQAHTPAFPLAADESFSKNTLLFRLTQPCDCSSAGEREKNSQESHSWPPLERTCSQSFAFRDMCAEEKWHKKFVTPRAALFFMSHTKREASTRRQNSFPQNLRCCLETRNMGIGDAWVTLKGAA